MPNVSSVPNVRREVIIDRPPDEVWAVVGRPELIHLWFPGVRSCRMDEVDGRPHRIVTVGDGIDMPEEIVLVDHLQRRFRYRLATPAIREHRGTVDVIELDDGRSMLVYDTECEPGAMALVIGGACGGAAEELARQFAAGDGPALRAAGLIEGRSDPAVTDEGAA